jgi:hypothetical protein
VTLIGFKELVAFPALLSFSPFEEKKRPAHLKVTTYKGILGRFVIRNLGDHNVVGSSVIVLKEETKQYETKQTRCLSTTKNAHVQQTVLQIGGGIKLFLVKQKLKELIIIRFVL